MKKNKPKKKRFSIYESHRALERRMVEILEAVRKDIRTTRANLSEVSLGDANRYHPNCRWSFEPISDTPAPKISFKKRTPVRDYLRLIAIVLVVALGAHFALKKMSGPPKGALYQISSGPGRIRTDYAISKPTLTASGCVVWFDLDDLGNIFCGEFIITDVPGRVQHEVVEKEPAPKE